MPIIKGEKNLYAFQLIDAGVTETDAIVIAAALAREFSPSSRCGLNDAQKKLFAQHKETLKTLKLWRGSFES